MAGDVSFVDHPAPSPRRCPPFVDADDFEEHVATFERTGFTGALNYYRAMDPTWHKLPELGTKPIEMPVTFIAGDKDPVLGLHADAVDGSAAPDRPAGDDDGPRRRALGAAGGARGGERRALLEFLGVALRRRCGADVYDPSPAWWP